MRVIESAKARMINFKATHFNMFSEGRKLKALKDIHKNQYCVIVGNGPSLRAEDLDILKEHNVITFAFNRIYHIFDSTDWRPTYYVSQDEKMLAGCIEEVEKIDAKIKFIPAEMNWYQDIHINGVQEFHIIHRENDGLPEFSEDISRHIVNSSTVVYTAIQIAVYMGIREIYLIGVDHHFQTSTNDKGEVVIDPTVKDYFCDNYNEDKDHLYIPNIDKSTLTYVAAKKYANMKGFHIYNATRGGKLEVFPRKKIDMLYKLREKEGE